MPLINLKTNLKSLKYGHDRPDGGSSDQPYIQTDVNNPITPLSLLIRNPAVRTFLKGVEETSSFLGLGRFNVNDAIQRAGLVIDKASNFDDGFIRGGVIGATNASITDTLRIAKFFTDAPKGPLFLARQAAMQLTNPRLEWKRFGVANALSNPLKFIADVGKDLLTFKAGNIAGSASSGYLGPTRLYNLGINTIAQIPANYIGGHILRHGLLPISFDDKYEDIAKWNNQESQNAAQDKITGIISSLTPPANRLLRLTQQFELGDGQGEIPNTSETIRELRRQVRQRNKEGRRKARAEDRANRDAAIQARKKFATELSLKAYFNIGGDGSDDSNPFSNNPLAIQAAAVNVFNSAMMLPLTSFGRQKIRYKNEKYPTTSKADVDFYLTGPGSVYGIGFTSIKRYSYTEDQTRIEESLEHSRNNAGKYLQFGKSSNRNEYQYIDPDVNASSLITNALGSNKRLSKDSKTQEIGAHPEVIEFDTDEIAKATKHTRYQNYDAVLADVEKTSLLSGINPLLGIYSTARFKDNYDYNQLSNVASHYDNGVPFDASNQIQYVNSYGDVVSINPTIYDYWWKLSRESNIGSARQDSINLTPMFKAGSGDAVDWEGVKINNIDYRIKDLVPFMIEAIDGTTPTDSIYMVFRAYITDLSDSVDSEWTDIKYIGRGEKFYVYTGFSRKINISFKVAALSEKEMKPMYQKLNALMGNLMPDYVGQNSGVMRGPLVRMTVGNWINSQPGKLDSLTYKVTNDSPWEVSIDRRDVSNTTSSLILPHIVEVSLNFTPIGSQTKGQNRLSNKESETNFVSHIAQVNNSKATTHYIDGTNINNPGSQNNAFFFYPVKDQTLTPPVNPGVSGSMLDDPTLLPYQPTIRIPPPFPKLQILRDSNAFPSKVAVPPPSPVSIPGIYVPGVNG